VKPDIIASAKALQVGATISSEKWAIKERGAVSSTWGGGHRIDMAVALATIETIRREKLLQNAKRVGGYMLKILREIRDEHKPVLRAEGLGLMLKLDISNPRERDRIVQSAFRKGLLLLGCGKKSIRIVPPLIIREPEAGLGLEILKKAIKT
jgi:4-aminobutyrate aminotransferase